MGHEIGRALQLMFTGRTKSGVLEERQLINGVGGE